MHAKADNVLAVDARLEYPNFRLAISHDIVINGVTGLFGPSGSGKSSLLRIIAGLNTTAVGKVAFSNRVWQDSNSRIFVPAHRRPVGYVFQDARLFEHLPVDGNLQYAVRRAGGGGRPIRYDDVLTAFDLQALLHRRTGTLSGGERQRVAIARTLLTQPRLLLLDEPLAALDAGRKSEILPYLEQLPAAFGIPALYVSHAVDEISQLADNVIVLEHGELKAAGAAAGILNQPDIQLPLSRFDLITILETRVIGHEPDHSLTRLDFRGQTIFVPAVANKNKGDVVRLYIRAGDVAISTCKPEQLSFRNVLAGELTAVEADKDSAFALVAIDVGGTLLRAHLTRHAIQELGLEPGKAVFALLKTASFDRRT